MAISTSALPFVFTVSSVTGQVDTDTFVNIHKRREEVVYRSQVSADAAAIAFVDTEDVLSENNFSIVDKSTFLSANRDVLGNFIVHPSIKTVVYQSEKVLITDVFTSPQNTVPDVPLFLVHTLKNVGGGTLLSAEILDATLQFQATTEKSLNLTTGVLYNNTQNSYRTAEDYTVHYVRYEVNSGGEIIVYTELLDNDPAFTIAEFDDLDGGGQIIVDGRKVYLVEEVAGAFEITLPIFNRYAFRTANSARLRIVPPAPSNREEPWFARVAGGSFKSNVKGGDHKYHVAEIFDQVFEPVFPFKRVISEQSTFLSSSLFKLDQENIRQDSGESLFLEVLIDDADDVGVAALTTDVSIVGNIAPNGVAYQMWTNDGRVGIRGVDSLSGIVDVEGLSLRADYTYTSSYYYEETNYVFTAIDFNPLNNPAILEQMIILFIDPDGTEQTLYYAIVDEKGLVIVTDFPPLAAIVAYYRIQHSDGPVAEGLYLDDLAVEGEGDGVMLTLGEITVGPTTGLEQASIFDARVRGGGLLESSYDTIRPSNSEVEWYWDKGAWDGTPYPGNASYLIELPADVLVAADDTLTSDELGLFVQDQVKEIVKRHTALEVYPLVKTYSSGILIESVVPENEVFTVDFIMKGRSSAKTLYYEIFVSTSYDGPLWEEVVSLTADSGGTNSEAVAPAAGVIPGVFYYILIVPSLEMTDNADKVRMPPQAVGPVTDGIAGLTISEATRIKVVSPLHMQTASLLFDFTVV